MPFVLNLDVGEKIFAKLQYIFEFFVANCQFFRCQLSIFQCNKSCAFERDSSALTGFPFPTDSVLTTQNLQLKTQNSKLTTQNLQLKTYNSKLTTHNSQLNQQRESDALACRIDVDHFYFHTLTKLKHFVDRAYATPRHLRDMD